MLWSLLVPFASDAVLFSNKDACEFQAWQIETHVKGFAIYEEKRCTPVKEGSAKQVLSVVITNGKVYFRTFDEFGRCQEYVSIYQQLQWRSGHPKAAWCAYTDRGQKVDVNE